MNLPLVLSKYTLSYLGMGSGLSHYWKSLLKFTRSTLWLKLKPT